MTSLLCVILLSGKKSKKGRLTLEKDGDSYKTVTDGAGDAAKDVLIEVFRDGALMNDQTFKQIQARSAV